MWECSQEMVILILLVLLQSEASLDTSWLGKYGEIEVKRRNFGNSTNLATGAKESAGQNEIVLLLGTFFLEEEELKGRKEEVVLFRGTAGGRGSTPKPSIVVTEEDKKIRKDWGGNCTNYHWLICVNQTTFGKDVFDEDTKEQIGFQLNCADQDLFPPVCMFNGWTVTRCHLLCMSKECNRDLKINYDEYVSKDGFC